MNSTRQHDHEIDLRSRRWLDPLLIALILGLGAYLRFHNVGGTPGYYSDEGTILEISRHLRDGTWQYMALTESTLLVARMPIFPLLVVAVSEVFGEGIQSLRMLSASLGVLSILGVLALSTRLGGRCLAYTAAAVLAVYPQAVIYSRLGFSYNLLALFAIGVGLASVDFIGTNRASSMFVAGLLVGIGTLSDISMAVYLVPAALIASTRHRRSVVALLVGAGLPVAAYGGYMLASAQEAFLFDLRFILTRLSAIPLVAQFPVAALNYARLLQLDPWFIPAILGIFVIRPQRSRWFMLLYLALPLLLIGRSVTGLPERGYHYLVPLLPFAAIGIAALVLAGTPRVHHTLMAGLDRMLEAWNWQPAEGSVQWITRRAVALLVALGLFVLILSPFVMSAMAAVIGINHKLPTLVDELLVDPSAATQAAAYVNQRTKDSDLVLASPAVAWMIDSQVADFQLSLAADGSETLHLPPDIPAERLAYDPSPARARFVIVDGIWRDWASTVMPEVADFLHSIQGWPVVFEANDIRVYENPLYR